MKRLVVLVACLAAALGSVGLAVREGLVGEEQEHPLGSAEIAAAIGCTLDTAVDAQELREAACEAKGNHYWVMSFSSAGGEKVWLDEAKAYGGTYLVGPRWVVVSQPEGAAEALKAELGGELQKGSTHHGSGDSDPHGTATPASPHGTATPASPHGTATPASPHGTATHASPHGTATPASPHGTATPANPHGTATPANPHGTATPANPHATTTHASPHGTATPANPHGTASHPDPHGTAPHPDPHGTASHAAPDGTAHEGASAG
ncbi:MULTISPECIES: hypothetical protein [unclassified Streptomyces]|uniref:Lipoprotein n=1 Tax=Streptomyces sp. NBC_00060 TaxID=2975636 RepID=A0AAU2HCM6_9ACTN